MTANVFYGLMFWISAPAFLAIAVWEVRRRNISVREWWFWAAGAGGLILYSAWVHRWVGIPVSVFAASVGFLGFEAGNRWAAEMRESQQEDDV